MDKQKYMLTKSEPSYSKFLAVMESQRLGLNYTKIKSCGRATVFKERGATLKPQYFLIMQITNHNLCVEFKSNCDASNAPLHQENTKQFQTYVQLSNSSLTMLNSQDKQVMKYVPLDDC